MRAVLRRQLCLISMVLGAFGCSRRDEPPPLPLHPAASVLAAPSAAPSARSPGAPARAAVASAVVEIRERALPLVAPDKPPRTLAFGKGFLVQAQGDVVRVLDDTSGEELVRAPIEAPRGVVPLPGGSVLVAGLDASFRFDPKQEVPHRRQRLSLLPNAELVQHPNDLESVWVVEPSTRRLMRYALNADAGLGIAATLDVGAFDGRAVTQLRDGRFLLTSRDGLVVVGPGSTQRTLGMPPEIESLWRLLPATRIDCAWVVTEHGRFVLVALEARARVLRSVETGLAPFDVAATPERIALVSVTRPPEPRRFRLHVYTAAAEPLFAADLPAAPPGTGEDWARAIIADKQVVLRDNPPRVAVGGPSAVSVFDAATGERLFGP